MFFLISKKNSTQQPLQRIWAFGLMEKCLVFGKIWQIRRMGLIKSQTRCSAKTLCAILVQKKQNN
jgi:hypothetical protein